MTPTGRKGRRWWPALLLAAAFAVAARPGGPAAATTPGTPLAGRLMQGRVVVLDPGHGGYDPGAIGRQAQEARINLAVALALKDWFERAGARVLMTWSSPADIPAHRKYRVEDRVRWINATDGEVLIDIHCNAGAGAWGPQVFYWDGAPSRLLADYVAQELHYFTHTHRAVTRIDQYVLRHARMPAINVEVGFITNPREERQLLDPGYQRELAWYIFVGTERWFLRSHWPPNLLQAPPPTDLLVR